MSELISICAPVCNEASTLGNTLESIEHQFLPPTTQLEVLVCANGCTDDTLQVAKDLKEKYPNIVLTTCPVASKPKAWNCLFNTARGDTIVFTDGDVLLDPYAVGNLDAHLKSTEDVLAAGMGIPYLEDESPLQRIFVTCLGYRSKSSERGYLTGQLYAMSKERLKPHLNKTPEGKMPEDLIAEDAWLEFLLGEDNWSFLPEAKFTYRYPSWKDYAKILARYKRGRLQLAESGMHPEPEGLMQWGFKYYWDKFLSQETPEQKALLISGFVLRRLFKAYSNLRNYSQDCKDNAIWERAESTKRPVPLSAIGLVA
jgi:glycosyltransferase involved in cell wall biosynthesis